MVEDAVHCSYYGYRIPVQETLFMKKNLQPDHVMILSVSDDDWLLSVT